MTQPSAGRKRLLPRMRLATLLMLVAVVGGSAGRYASSVRVQRQAVRALLDAGAVVIYDWEWDLDGASSRSNGEELAGWRRLVAERFGPDAVASVAAVSLRGIQGEGGKPGATDEHIELVGRLKSLRSLELGRFAVSEEGAATIAGLEHLRAFAINDPFWRSDPGPILARLGEDPRLERLILIGAILDDEDIAAISRFARLEALMIVGGSRNIGDADLAKLSALGHLKDLEFWPSRITPEGVKSLGTMSSLESLTFDGSSIGNLAPLRQLPRLRHLDTRLMPGRLGRPLIAGPVASPLPGE